MVTLTQYLQVNKKQMVINWLTNGDYWQEIGKYESKKQYIAACVNRLAEVVHKHNIEADQPIQATQSELKHYLECRL